MNFKFSDYLKTNHPNSWLLEFRNKDSKKSDIICDECIKHNLKLKESKLCKSCDYGDNN